MLNIIIGTHTNSNFKNLIDNGNTCRNSCAIYLKRYLIKNNKSFNAPIKYYKSLIYF